MALSVNRAALLPARARIQQAPAPVRMLPLVQYTSLPERMGEQAENPAASIHDAQEPGLSGRHMSYIHESRDEDTTKRHRASDEAEQARVMSVLHEIESAAMAANKEAGHPELHRMAADDYLDMHAPASDSREGDARAS